MAGAQQPLMPVIGWLGTGWPDTSAGQMAAFNKGLNEAGFVDGRNATVEYRCGILDFCTISWAS